MIVTIKAKTIMISIKDIPDWLLIVCKFLRILSPAKVPLQDKFTRRYLKVQVGES